MDDVKGSVSFGFKRKQESIQLGKSIVNEDVNKEDKETDYVLSLEGKEIKATKSSHKSSRQEYVIPLIKHNKWRRGDSDKIERLVNVLSYQDSVVASTTNLDEQAAKEILQDTAKCNEEWNERGTENTSLVIPLLVQNKVPEGFESDEKLDVALRPDEPNDYDQIPIEHFGLAMLRGMGWSKDRRGVGKNNKVINVIEAHVRPKGLGLGADRNNSGPDKKATPDCGQDNEAKLEFKKNAFCLVTAGKDKDLYGTIEGFDEDNSRVMLKLALSGKVVNILQSSVCVVSKSEFDKYSKYLNKQKADEYKANERKRMENGDGNKSSLDNERQRIIHSDNNSDIQDSKPKRHKREEKQSRDYEENEQKIKHSSRDDRHSKHQVNSKLDTNRLHSEQAENKITSVPWLRNDLKVRVIDKGLSRGKYYKEKVVIIDVPYPGKCVFKTDDGKLVENVSQSSLETVVPRLENAFVAIVGGSYRGQIGQIMDRDKYQCLAHVQLLSDRDVVLKLPYDDICEFVGNVQHQYDY